MFIPKILLAVSGSAVLFHPLSATPHQRSGDWLQFRGPGGQGIAPGSLPVAWSQSENLAWKTALPGAGSSSPIVVGSRVFVTCYSGFNVPGQGGGSMDRLKLHVVCLDRASGKLRWNREIAPKLPEQEKIRDDHGYASSTPVSDGEHVFAFFGASGVVALDLEGRVLWRTEVGSRKSGFGTGASPILFNDLVIVNASVESESLIALDKKTGKVRWRLGQIKEAYNTPVLVPMAGGRQELVVGMMGRVIGVDPATGSQLWTCNNGISWYIVPSIVHHGGTVWSLGGRSGITAACIRASGKGDVTQSHRVWTNNLGCNVSSPILHNGHLYFINDREALVCLEAKSGRMVFEERVPRADQVWASPILAGEKLYFLNRRGDTFVLAAAPKYQLLGVNRLGDGSTFNATPAAAGNQIFIRSDKAIYCIGTR